jgi:hypothetical protein
MISRISLSKKSLPRVLPEISAPQAWLRGVRSPRATGIRLIERSPNQINSPSSRREARASS